MKAKEEKTIQEKIQNQAEEFIPETLRKDKDDFDFRKWIRHQKHEGYTFTEERDDLFLLTTPYGKAEIQFYLEDDIAEISIIRNRDNELRYYLHFQVLDKKHAIGLYHEMEEILLSLKKEQTLHILLSCTSGATTGFLAEKLNQAAELMGIDYKFDATSYLLLYEKAQKADIILIAPQIRYLQKKLEIAIPNKPIIPIPTKMFTSNNVGELLDFIENTLQEKQGQKLQQEEKEASSVESNVTPSLEDYIVLQMMILFDYNQFKVRMRLRDHGQLILDETSLHRKLTTAGLRGEIEYALRGVSHCDLVSIAMPGAVSEGKVEYGPYSKMHLEDKQFKHYIEETFNTNCLLVNGVNVATYGYYVLHPEKKNVMMLSQPFGTFGGGIGSVIEGEIVVGREGIAGESRYFIERMQFSGPLRQLAKTEQGQMEIVIANLLPAICLLGPELFLLRTPIVSNMTEVRNHLQMFLPQRLIPELVFIEDVSELVFAGLRQMAQNYLQSSQFQSKEKE